MSHPIATRDGRIDGDRSGHSTGAVSAAGAESGAGTPLRYSGGDGHDSGLTTSNRREFLGTLGGVAAASTMVVGPGRAQDTPTVLMGNDYFAPVGLFVEPGTTVRFEIEEGSHSATAYPSRIPDSTSAFDTGVISSGSVSVTFDTPGTYDYYCIPHEAMGMVGRIVVGSPGGPAEATALSTGDVPDSDTIVDRGSVAGDGSDASGAGPPGGMGSGMPASGPLGGHGDLSSWHMLFPLGMMTALLGTLGAVVYGAARLGRADGQDRGD